MIYFVGKEIRGEDKEGIEICSIQHCLNYFKSKKYIQLDTETEGFDPYTKEVICWQIGDYENQFVIDNSIYPFENYKEFFEDESKVFILQNAKFDLRFFFHKRVIIKSIYDTFLAEKLLTLDQPFIKKSLDALVERYANSVEVDKDIRGQIHWRGLDKIVIKYAAYDVKFLEIIKDKQEEKLKRKDLLKNISLQNKYCRVLAYCEYCGFKIDEDQWKILYKSNLKKLKDIEEELNNYVIDNFPKYRKAQLDLFRPIECGINWNSSDQVLPLFEELGLNPWIEDKGVRKKSVGAEVINPQKHLNPIFSIYLQYKQLSKLVTTYGQNFLDQINPVSGRLHTQFNQIINTGRLSSGGKDKELGIENINFQNIPSDPLVRKCFISENNNTLVVADYSG